MKRVLAATAKERFFLDVIFFLPGNDVVLSSSYRFAMR